VKICNKKKKIFASETNTFHISYVESKKTNKCLRLLNSEDVVVKYKLKLYLLGMMQVFEKSLYDLDDY
jgi:hypothetical protein